MCVVECNQVVNFEKAIAIILLKTLLLHLEKYITHDQLAKSNSYFKFRNFEQ